MNDTLTIIPAKTIPRTLIVFEGYDHYVIDDPARVKQLESLIGELKGRGISNDYIVDVLLPYIDRDNDHIEQWCGRNKLAINN